MVAMVFRNGAHDKALSDAINAGRNEPPDPAQAFSLHLDDLEEQARQFLDGDPIANEAQAEAVSRLLSMVRKASNDADEARKVEKKPHDDAAKEVQSKWKPILTKADLIAETAKKVLTPWLNKLADEQRAAAEAERQEAERLAAAAREALEKAGTSLSARIGAEALLKAAGAADRTAKRAEKAKAHVEGGERAVGLRTTYKYEITDTTAFARWVWGNRKNDMATFLDGIAAKEARQGPRTIPGLLIEIDCKV